MDDRTRRLSSRDEPEYLPGRRGAVTPEDDDEEQTHASDLAAIEKAKEEALDEELARQKAEWSKTGIEPPKGGAYSRAYERKWYEDEAFRKAEADEMKKRALQTQAAAADPDKFASEHRQISRLASGFRQSLVGVRYLARSLSRARSRSSSSSLTGSDSGTYTVRKPYSEPHLLSYRRLSGSSPTTENVETPATLSDVRRASPFGGLDEDLQKALLLSLEDTKRSTSPDRSAPIDIAENPTDIAAGRASPTDSYGSDEELREALRLSFQGFLERSRSPSDRPPSQMGRPRGPPPPPPPPPPPGRPLNSATGRQRHPAGADRSPSQATGNAPPTADAGDEFDPDMQEAIRRSLEGIETSGEDSDDDESIENNPALTQQLIQQGQRSQSIRQGRRGRPLNSARGRRGHPAGQGRSPSQVTGNALNPNQAEAFPVVALPTPDRGITAAARRDSHSITRSRRRRARSNGRPKSPGPEETFPVVVLPTHGRGIAAAARRDSHSITRSRRRRARLNGRPKSPGPILPGSLNHEEADENGPKTPISPGSIPIFDDLSELPPPGPSAGQNRRRRRRRPLSPGPMDDPTRRLSPSRDERGHPPERIGAVTPDDDEEEQTYASDLAAVEKAKEEALDEELARQRAEWRKTGIEPPIGGAYSLAYERKWYEDEAFRKAEADELKRKAVQTQAAAADADKLASEHRQTSRLPTRLRQFLKGVRHLAQSPPGVMPPSHSSSSSTGSDSGTYVVRKSDYESNADFHKALLSLEKPPPPRKPLRNWGKKWPFRKTFARRMPAVVRLTNAVRASFNRPPSPMGTPSGPPPPPPSPPTADVGDVEQSQIDEAVRQSLEGVRHLAQSPSGAMPRSPSSSSSTGSDSGTYVVRKSDYESNADFHKALLSLEKPPPPRKPLNRPPSPMRTPSGPPPPPPSPPTTDVGDVEQSQIYEAIRRSLEEN